MENMEEFEEKELILQYKAKELVQDYLCLCFANRSALDITPTEFYNWKMALLENGADFYRCEKCDFHRISSYSVSEFKEKRAKILEKWNSLQNQKELIEEKKQAEKIKQLEKEKEQARSNRIANFLRNPLTYLKQIKFDNEPLTKTESETCRQLLRIAMINNDHLIVLKLYRIIALKIDYAPQEYMSFIIEFDYIVRQVESIKSQQQSQPNSSCNNQTEEYNLCIARLSSYIPRVLSICLFLLRKLGLTEMDIEFSDLSDIDKPNSDMPDKNTNLPDNNPI